MKTTNNKKIKSIFGKTDRINVTPDQYSILSFTGINRSIKAALVKKMRESVLRHGCLRNVIVVWDNFTSRYVIVDGQHLTRALQALNRNIECVVVECETEADMTQLMIDLNNVSKTWSLGDYIHGWAESGNKDYKTLRLEIERAGLQHTVTTMAYTQKRRGMNTKAIKEGTFKIADKKRGDELISNVKDCINYTPNTRDTNEALIQLMVSVGHYDHKKMLTNLKNAIQYVPFSRKESEIFNQLLKIYNGK